MAENSGPEEGIKGVVEDVTERHQVEQALARAKREGRHRVVCDEAPEPETRPD